MEMIELARSLQKQVESHRTHYSKLLDEFNKAHKKTQRRILLDETSLVNQKLIALQDVYRELDPIVFICEKIYGSLLSVNKTHDKLMRMLEQATSENGIIMENFNGTNREIN
jgi:plasmid replication initiation protein